MARMHGRDKGKSGSSTPQTIDTTHVTLKPKEIEKIIVKLTKAGKTPSQIGMMLRDSYGIPTTKAVTKKSITQMQKEQKVAQDLPENLSALIKKEIKLYDHIEGNNKDKEAKRGLQLTQSKIRRLIKYYKKTGALKKDWKYTKEQARLLVD